MTITRSNGAADPPPEVPRQLVRITSPTLVQSAVQALRQSILDGAFEPGERLVEARLAEQLGISRGPLREALHLLEQEGIVANSPRRGKFVASLDDRLIDELYTLRKALEVFAVERVVAIAGSDALDELRASIARMREDAEAGDVPATAREDIFFHGLLYRLADHSLLERAWLENIAGKLRILTNTTTRTHPFLEEPVHRHEVILKAIEARDPERARMEVAIHVEDARLRALAVARGERPATRPARLRP